MREENPQDKLDSGQQLGVAAQFEFLKAGKANIETMNAATANIAFLDIVENAQRWKPFPAGNYGFSSGTQTVAEGILAVGASTTAPTFGTGTVKKGWYHDNRDGTIDTMYYIKQTTNAGVANGTGTYQFPIPNIFAFDLSFLTRTSNGYDGSTCGTLKLSSLNTTPLRTLATGFATVTDASFNNFIFPMTSLDAAGGSVIGLWSATFFQPSTRTEFTMSGVISRIPVILI
jgi:hypothetical protein